jgi:hypothetical protein
MKRVVGICLFQHDKFVNLPYSNSVRKFDGYFVKSHLQGRSYRKSLLQLFDEEEKHNFLDDMLVSTDSYSIMQ